MKFITDKFEFVMNLIADTFQFLNENSGAIQAIATIVLVLVTMFYAYHTRKSVKTMEKANDFNSRPFISAFADTNPAGPRYVDLIVRNDGNGAAKDIRLEVDGDDIELTFQPKGYDKLSDLRVFKNGIKILPPKKERRYLILGINGSNHLDDILSKNTIVKLSYTDMNDKPDSISFPLDFWSLSESKVVTNEEKNTREISESLKTIATSMKDKK